MKNKILIKKSEFRESEGEKIDLNKIKDLEKVDVDEDGVWITFILGE